MDLYAPIGTQIYTCVDCEVNEIYTSGGDYMKTKFNQNGNSIK